MKIGNAIPVLIPVPIPELFNIDTGIRSKNTGIDIGKFFIVFKEKMYASFSIIREAFL